MIPTTIISDEAGKSFIGFARDQLRILRNLMSFQKLNQGYRKENPIPGVLVECWSSHDYWLGKEQSWIKISSVIDNPISEEEVIKKENQICPCFPCFSMGQIMVIRTVPTEEEYRDGIRFEYDCAVCVGNKYIILENHEIKAAAWEEYYVGQRVLVGIDVLLASDPIPNCCINNACLFSALMDTDKLVPMCFSIYPVHMVGMPAWLKS